MTALAHLSDGGRTDPRLCAEILFLDVFVNEKFPEFLITDCHNNSPSGIAKALRLAGIFVYVSNCRHYYSAAGSVVIYYNSEPTQRQGENAIFARFLLKSYAAIKKATDIDMSCWILL